MSEEIEVYESCGNVFADLGLPDPEILLAKATLSIHLGRAIEAQGLTRRAAARRIGISDTELTNLLKRGPCSYEMEALIRSLNALGVSVHVSVTPTASGEPGQMSVDPPR